MVNGFDSLIVTKLDVLDDLDEIPVCVGYRVSGRDVSEMPATNAGIELIEAVYQKLPGWRTDTTACLAYADLPERARDYVQFLSTQSGVEVGCVSVGPERNQTMILPGSKLERLLAR
jgi:adenylosuccinate synthase